MVFFVPIAYCSKNQRKHTIILHESMTLLHWLLTDILKTEYLCLKPGLLFFLFIRSFLSSRVRQDICLGTDQVNTLNFTNYQGKKRHCKLSTLGQCLLRGMIHTGHAVTPQVPWIGSSVVRCHESSSLPLGKASPVFQWFYGVFLQSRSTLSSKQLLSKV